jgi:hypothetical protein
MKKFLIVRAGDPDRREFDTAQEVAVFMWGRDRNKYRLYIRGPEWAETVNDIETQLKKYELS